MITDDSVHRGRAAATSFVRTITWRIVEPADRTMAAKSKRIAR
jgi:hypothetical protein